MCTPIQGHRGLFLSCLFLSMVFKFSVTSCTVILIALLPDFTHKSFPITLLVSFQLFGVSGIQEPENSIPDVSTYIFLPPFSRTFFRDNLKIALAFSCWDFSILRQICISRMTKKFGIASLNYRPNHLIH